MPKLIFPTSPGLNIRHPFQVDLISKAKPGGGGSSGAGGGSETAGGGSETAGGESGIKNEFFAAITYNSSLFKNNFKKGNEATKLDYEIIPIKGLGEYEKLEGFPDSEKKYYCMLEIKINSLQAEDDPKIIWVRNSEMDEYPPIEFESEENLIQTFARIIIAVILSDKNEIPIDSVTGLEEAEKTESQYALQYINTNLVLFNMSANGYPVIYPIPFAGGRLIEQNN